MDNKRPLISIIVPIYNTEQFLNRCLESIINQSFKDFELILVDDGSTDSSRKICNEWLQKDNRIQVVHKKNEGVTIARKTGIAYATGKWACFVDSDDTLPPNAIDVLTAQIRHDVDMVLGTVQTIGTKALFYKQFGEKHRTQYINILLKHPEYWGPYSRLIRKSLFDDFIFNIPSEIKIGEDFIMNLRLAQKVRKVILLHDVVYYYIWRPSSAMANHSNLNLIYEELYITTTYESIYPEYQKALRGALFCFRIKVYYRFIKRKTQKCLFYKQNH